MKLFIFLKHAYQKASIALAVLLFGMLYLLFGAGYLFVFVWIPISPLIA